MNEHRSEGIALVEQPFCGLRGCFLSDTFPEAPPPYVASQPKCQHVALAPITAQELGKQMLLPASRVATGKDQEVVCENTRLKYVCAEPPCSNLHGFALKKSWVRFV